MRLIDEPDAWWLIPLAIIVWAAMLLPLWQLLAEIYRWIAA